MKKQNPAYEWLFLIFFLTFCSGCANMHPGLREFFEYQIAKELIKIGKKELKKEYKQGISLEEYEERRKSLRIKSPKGNLIETDVLIITRKGKIRIPKKRREALNEEVNRAIGLRKEKIHLSFSLSLSKVKFKADYGRWEFEYKQYYDGDWEFWFGYEIKF